MLVRHGPAQARSLPCLNVPKRLSYHSLGGCPDAKERDALCRPALVLTGAAEDMRLAMHLRHSAYVNADTAGDASLGLSERNDCAVEGHQQVAS